MPFLSDYAKRMGTTPGLVRFQSREVQAMRRRRGCIVPGCNEPAQCHHLIPGYGPLASDILTVGLCEGHHTGPQGIHTMGERRFEELHCVSLLGEAIAGLDALMAEQGMDLMHTCIVAIESALSDAGLATTVMIESRRVSEGSAKSRSTKASNFRELKKGCNTQETFRT